MSITSTSCSVRTYPSLLQKVSLHEVSFGNVWRDSEETEQLIIIYAEDFLHYFGHVKGL